MNVGGARGHAARALPRVRWNQRRTVRCAPSTRRESSPAKQEDKMAQATTLSPQALADAAKAPFLAYNDKDWTKAKATITPDFTLRRSRHGPKGDRCRCGHRGMEGLGASVSRFQGNDPQRARRERRDRDARGHVEGHAQGAVADTERGDRTDRKVHRGPGLRDRRARRGSGQGPAALLRHGDDAAAAWSDWLRRRTLLPSMTRPAPTGRPLSYRRCRGRSSYQASTPSSRRNPRRPTAVGRVTRGSSVRSIHPTSNSRVHSAAPSAPAR